jgi:hypothetical protein
MLEQADGYQRHFGNETLNTILLYVVSIFPFTYNAVHTVQYTAAKLTNNSRIDGDCDAMHDTNVFDSIVFVNPGRQYSVIEASDLFRFCLSYMDAMMTESFSYMDSRSQISTHRNTERTLQIPSKLP